MSTASASTAGLLTASGLSKDYGAGYRLGPVTFSFAAGATIGVLGKNGAGKSTLFQLLTGNLDASSGEVRLGGSRMTPDTAALKRRIGYLPQHHFLPRWATGRELLSYAASLYSLPNAAAAIPAAEAYWDCAGYNGKPLMTLSYGMQKRVALALATLHDPECLILDEPFSGLDLFHIKALEEAILMRAKTGKLTILSTHITAFCARLCQQVWLISAGLATQLPTWEGLAPMARESAIEAAFFSNGGAP